MMRNTWQGSSGSTKHFRFTWARGTVPWFKNRNILFFYSEVILLKILSSAVKKRNDSAKYTPGHTLVSLETWTPREATITEEVMKGLYQTGNH